MNLRRLQWHWNLFGLRDPFWAVLTHPDKKNRRWDRDEFFQTGIAEFESVLQHVESFVPALEKRSALDFGCGLGRVTQAMALHFEQVTGVDIAPSMVERARDHNRHGARCRYTLNAAPDLRVLDDRRFDFIYSNMTLQHMPLELGRAYIREFLRLLAPRGVLLFQMPSRPRKSRNFEYWFRKLYYDVLRNCLRPRTPYMEMHGADQEAMIRFLEENGAKILDVARDDYAQPHWEGFRYLATRLT